MWYRLHHHEQPAAVAMARVVVAMAKVVAAKVQAVKDRSPRRRIRSLQYCIPSHRSRR